MFIENLPGVMAYIEGFEGNANEKAFEIMSYAGTFFKRHARTHKKFIDHTGNLKNSIGYVVAIDGKIKISSFGEPGDTGKKGAPAGEELAKAVLSEHKEGIVLIGDAGMSYGLYVENMKNKSVISQSIPETERLIKRLME